MIKTSRWLNLRFVQIVSYVILFLILPYTIYSQTVTAKTISMAEAVSLTLANNPISRNTELQVKSAKNRSLSNVSLASTEINYANGQFYSSMHDSYFEVNQHFGSPLTYIQTAKYNKQAEKLSEIERLLTVKKLTASAKIGYTTCVYYRTKLSVIKDFNVLYTKILEIKGVPYNPADSNQVTRITNETSFANFQNQMYQAEQDISLADNELQLLVNSKMQYTPTDSSLEMYAIEILNSGPNKFNSATNNLFYLESCDLQQKKIGVEQSKIFPEITAGYFNREINGNKGFQGFKIGLALPLWWVPQKTQISEARIKLEVAKNEADYQKFNTSKNIENLKIQLDKLFVQISFFRENALKMADLLVNKMLQDSQLSNPDYTQLFDNLDKALKIQLDYLETIYRYNQTAIRLESLID